MLQLIQSINQPIIDQKFFFWPKKRKNILLKYDGGGGDQIGFQRNHTIIIVVDGVWNNNYLHEIRIKCKWKWLYIVDLDYNLIIIIWMYLKKKRKIQSTWFEYQKIHFFGGYFYLIIHLDIIMDATFIIGTKPPSLCIFWYSNFLLFPGKIISENIHTHTH